MDKIKQQIERDIKAAMLAGDKQLVTTLRGIKSAILYGEVAKGARDAGLPEEEVIALLGKEAKKRQESAMLYRQGGDEARADAELAEVAIIQGYLPPQMSDDDLNKVVTRVVDAYDELKQSYMGEIIARVKQEVGPSADGARIAKVVKEKLLG